MSEYLLPKKICTMALAFVTVIACATSASAQSVPNKADSISAAATPSSAQSQRQGRDALADIRTWQGLLKTGGVSSRKRGSQPYRKYHHLRPAER